MIPGQVKMTTLATNLSQTRDLPHTLYDRSEAGQTMELHDIVLPHCGSAL